MNFFLGTPSLPMVHRQLWFQKKNTIVADGSTIVADGITIVADGTSTTLVLT